MLYRFRLQDQKWRMWTFFQSSCNLVGLVWSEVSNLIFIVHLGSMGFFQVKFVMSDALFDLAASSKATIRRVSSILPNRGRKCSYRRNRGGEGLKKNDSLPRWIDKNPLHPWKWTAIEHLKTHPNLKSGKSFELDDFGFKIWTFQGTNSWDPTVGRFQSYFGWQLGSLFWGEKHMMAFVHQITTLAAVFFGLFLTNMEPEKYVFGKA